MVVQVVVDVWPQKAAYSRRARHSHFFAVTELNQPGSQTQRGVAGEQKWS